MEMMKIQSLFVSIAMIFSITGCSFMSDASHAFGDFSHGMGDAFANQAKRSEKAAPTNDIKSNAPRPSNHSSSEPSNSYTGNSGRQSTIADVQAKLGSLDYDLGPADGMMGRRTRAAIRAYQKDNGLKQTGTLDRDTLITLGIMEQTTRQAASNDPVASEDDKAATDDGAGSAAQKADSLRQEQRENNSGAAQVQPSDQTIESTNLWHLSKEQQATPATSQEAAAVAGEGQITTATTLASEASVMADSLGEIPRGASIEVLGEQNNFLKIRYNGKEGFVYSNFVTRK